MNKNTKQICNSIIDDEMKARRSKKKTNINKTKKLSNLTTQKESVPSRKFQAFGKTVNNTTYFGARDIYFYLTILKVRFKKIYQN